MKFSEEHIPEKSQKRLFLIMALGQLLLCVSILLFCNIKYEVSDDFIMEMVASGAYTGQPDAHIMFSNVILGWILTVFYRINADISWYFFLQMLLCLCSYIAMTYVLTHKLRTAAAVFTVITLTAFTAQDLYVLPQFTKTAAAASMSGLLLIIYGVFYKKKWYVCLLGGVLAVFGALVRRKAFYIAVLFAVIMVIYESIRVIHSEKWSFKQILCKAWIPGALVLISVMLCGTVNRLSYSSNSDYSAYHEFSTVRSQILDYYFPGYGECSEEFQEIGISENDYVMILCWDFADPGFFTTEKMQQVLDIVNENRNQKHATIIEALRFIKYRQLKYPLTIFCFVVGLLCIAVKPKNFWIPVLAGVETVVLFCHFFFVNRNVYRVEFAILYCAVALLACFFDAQITKKWLNYALCIAAVILAAVRVPSYIPDKSWKTMDDDQYRTMVYDTFYFSWDYGSHKYSNVIEPGEIRTEFLDTIKENPDNLYLLDFSTCIQTFYYDFSVFKSTRSIFPKNVVFFSGVTEYHPSVWNYIDELGNVNLMEMLLEDNVYFVGNNSPQMLLQYYHEHGKEDVELIPCGQIDDYQIWQYERTNSDR